MNTFFS